MNVEMPAASADFLIPPSSVRRSCVLKRAPDGDFVLHMKNSDCALSFEATIPRFSGACNLLRAHTVGDLDVQVHAAPSILDCVRLDFGNHSCLPSRCEHVRLAALWPAKLALDHGWRPPSRRSTGWDRVRVAYTASAPRRRVSWIAHGWVSTVGFRARVHLAGLFSVAALTKDRKHTKQVSSMPRGHRFRIKSSDAASPTQHNVLSMTGPLDHHRTLSAYQTRSHGVSDCATAWR